MMPLSIIHFFFFNDPATTKIYTLSLHDALPIYPRVHDIKITFKGASDGLSITNTTTGDVFVHNGQTNANDTIELEGIRMLKNGESIFRDTNHRLITLETGYNDFVINGATEGEFEIIFEFRFYYF